MWSMSAGSPTCQPCASNDTLRMLREVGDWRYSGFHRTCQLCEGSMEARMEAAVEGVVHMPLTTLGGGEKYCRAPPASSSACLKFL
jgi:hypothetical protein